MMIYLLSFIYKMPYQSAAISNGIIEVVGVGTATGDHVSVYPAKIDTDPVSKAEPLPHHNNKETFSY